MSQMRGDVKSPQTIKERRGQAKSALLFSIHEVMKTNGAIEFQRFSKILPTGGHAASAFIPLYQALYQPLAEPAYSYNVYSRFLAIVELDLVPFALISFLFYPCHN